MERFLIAAAIVVLAAIIAVVVERRRPDPPTTGRWAVPTQLDRNDFARPGSPWLVAVFSSATCDSCAGVVRKTAVLASDEVAVDNVDLAAKPDLHRRYRIDAVPTVVVADADGIVRASFLGPASATDLWAAVAELRDPGSSPEPNLGRLEG